MVIESMISRTIDSLQKIMDVNTVIGQPIVDDELTIIPISKMTIGFATGGAEIADNKSLKNKNNPLGLLGGGANIIPIGFLVSDGIGIKFIKTDGGDKWSECAQDLVKIFKK